MPWIFLCLMLTNAVYFGWKFMEGAQPQARPLAVESVQLGARLQLLSERPDLIPAPAPAPPDDKQSAVTAPVIVSAAQCFSVGPFSPGAGLSHFVEQMRGKRLFVRVDQRKVAGKDYWVFVPAFTNREKADERLRDLRGRGIDGFVVKEGVFVNAISLNHFSRKELAQAYLEKVRAAGVVVEYREIAQGGSEQWVYLSPGQSRANVRSLIDAQIAKSDGLRRENASCEE
ncbi:MAG: SPOR domain-containing protein [bacterium]|nr:SPOR domain-containing protein [bacterium]